MVDEEAHQTTSRDQFENMDFQNSINIKQNVAANNNFGFSGHGYSK